MTRLEAIKALNNLCEVRKKYGMATMEYEVKVLETAICSLEAWDKVLYDLWAKHYSDPNDATEVMMIINKYLQEVENDKE